MYDFDTAYNRKDTGSIKWDEVTTPNMLPMWVADMDFVSAPEIVKALHERVDSPIYGYSNLRQSYFDSVVAWMKRRHQLEIKSDWITFTPGVVIALNLAVQSVSEPGDEILIASPVYGPFRSAIGATSRVLVETTLVNNNGYYRFDFEDLESKISPKTKAFILCSPHNPVGRVWNREELTRLAEICIKHNLYLIADEIHCDLVFQPHISAYNISEEIADRCILCTAPSKTFNLAGLHASNIIIKNNALRQKFVYLLDCLHVGGANAFVEAATTAAYNLSEDWLDELLVYIKGNHKAFCDGINSRVPKLKVLIPEGTYLAWLDCRGLNMTEDELNTFFKDKCSLLFNEGTFFGEAGTGFRRVNLACPRSYVEEAVSRIEKGCKDLL